MAKFIKSLSAVRKSVPGQILAVVIYTAMIILILIFFSGHGEFIYETF